LVLVSVTPSSDLLQVVPLVIQLVAVFVVHMFAFARIENQSVKQLQHRPIARPVKAVSISLMRQRPLILSSPLEIVIIDDGYGTS
jgi:hypothetical protein